MPKLILVTRLIKDTTNQIFASLPNSRKIDLLKNALRYMNCTLNSYYPNTIGQVIRGILIAPEYFFSTKHNLPNLIGNCRQISQECRYEITRELETLSLQFPSILIIAGTVAWMKKLDQGDDKFKKRVDKYKGIISRRLEDPVRRSWHEKTQEFTDNPLDVAHTILKKIDNPSQAQDITVSRNTAFVYLNGQLCHRYHKNTDYREVVEMSSDDKLATLHSKNNIYIPGDNKGIFIIDDIKFGIEICSDHSHSALAVNHPEEELDIHIILSACVTNHKSHFRAQHNGYVLHASSEEIFNGIKISGFFINNAGKYIDVPLISHLPKGQSLLPSNRSAFATTILRIRKLNPPVHP